MRAVICTKDGGPDDLELGDTEPPSMTPGGVRVAIHAAGVNFADTLMIAGRYQVKPPHPFSPGIEAAGEVIECGPDVEGIKVGDRVAVLCGHGAFAEQVVVAENRVRLIPDAMDFVTAAAFCVAYGTAHLGLAFRARLMAGETLLVHGAGGGVGLTAVQIGKILGARIIATAGSDEKLQLAKENGADELINYQTDDIRNAVKELTKGRGADVIYDPVGGAVFDASLRAVAPGGRILIVGFASGKIPQVPANILLVKNVDVIGYYWGAYQDIDPDLVARSFATLFDWFEDGRIKPHVSKVYPMSEAGAALSDLAARRSTGKLVISMEDK